MSNKGKLIFENNILQNQNALLLHAILFRSFRHSFYFLSYRTEAVGYLTCIKRRIFGTNSTLIFSENRRCMASQFF